MSPISYLSDIPLQEARKSWEASLLEAKLRGLLEEEVIPIEYALNRVTSQPIWARHSSPHYTAAAMDGFALNSKTVEKANDKNPVSVDIGELAVYVDTGDPIPDWADCVVPVEDVQIEEPSADIRSTKRITIRSSCSPWKHVRPIGEDTMATELVIPAGHEIRAIDLGAIAGCGHGKVFVSRQPKVAILPTGTELVPPGTQPKPGEIIEFNSLVLASLVESWGGEAKRWPYLPDDVQQIREAVREASTSSDLVLVIAGSSAGSEDLTEQIVASLGEILVHGVAIRPGHPVLLGMLNSEGGRTPIIGVPGFPVSAVLTAELFVQPLVTEWLGRSKMEKETILATMNRKVHSSLGDEEYLRVTLGKVGDRVIAAPLSRGAGVITSLVRADGIVKIPAGVQGVQAGETISVELIRSKQAVLNTILMLGSHDLTIDILAQYLATRGSRLASAKVGSLGGLIALSRGEAHLAGAHLLDPESGEFNLPYIRKYLHHMPDPNVYVIGLVGRQQGLLVPKGNPKGVSGLSDLARRDIQFINRQQGSGTRYLLDYHLDLEGIEESTIHGYAQVEYDHLSLASRISSGRADCGLGIRAAANAMKLDFVHLFDERYDLVIPANHYHQPKLEPLLDILVDPVFQQAVAAIPGYDVNPMGTLIEVIRVDQ